MSQPGQDFYARWLGTPCAYCARTMRYGSDARPTRDHVMPKRLGWKLHHFKGRNRAIVCERCNTSKKGLTIFEFLDRLTIGKDRRAQIVDAFVADFVLHIAPWTEEQLRSGFPRHIARETPVVRYTAGDDRAPKLGSLFSPPRAGLVLRGGYWMEK